MNEPLVSDDVIAGHFRASDVKVAKERAWQRSDGAGETSKQRFGY